MRTPNSSEIIFFIFGCNTYRRRAIGIYEPCEEQDEETAVFGDVIDRVETQPPVLMTLADGSTNVVVTLRSSSGNRERNPTNVNKTSGLRTTTTSLKH